MKDVLTKVVKGFKRSSTVVIISAVLAVTCVNSVYINSDYEKSVVTRFGKIERVDDSGLNFKIPFVEEAHKADLRVSSLELPMHVATFDGQAIGLTLTVNHQIEGNNESLKTLYREFGQDFGYEKRLFNNLAIDRTKSVIGTYKLEDFMPNREQARLKAKNIITETSSEWGINVEDVQFASVDLGNNFRKRIEQVAEARAQAAQAEQQKRQAEFLALKAIETARGVAESKKLQAEANAYQITQESVAKADAIDREGQAKASALKAQAEVLKNSQGLVELTKAEAMKNWDGQFNPNVAMFGSGNGAGLLPFLNLTDSIK